MTMLITNAVTRKWTVGEYLHLADCGVFEQGPRVELLEGEIVVMSPSNEAHAWAIRKGTRLLLALYGETHEVSVQCPFRADSMSLPEPDFALVPIGLDSPDSHACVADLIVEAAFSSLAYDLGEKAALYARTGIPEYWVLDLVNARALVHTDPGVAAGEEGQVHYRSVETFCPGDSIQPVRVPGPPCPLASLFG